MGIRSDEKSTPKSTSKAATYWERIRYESAAQSSMYVVIDQGRLVMATTSLDLARQTFAKVRQGRSIDGLVGEHHKPSLEQSSDQIAEGTKDAANQDVEEDKTAA